MSETMVERVAKAIWAANGREPMDMAVAAIKAMRDPTAAMFDAAGRACVNFTNCKWDDPRVRADECGVRSTAIYGFEQAWQAMIDAALSEAEGERGC